MNNAIPIEVSEDAWGMRGKGPEIHAYRLPAPREPPAAGRSPRSLSTYRAESRDPEPG